jgi:small-conductance mechanosensitive channel
MEWDWERAWAWINVPWFSIGQTPITMSRMMGLVFILVFVWWFAVALETGLRRVHLRGGANVSGATVYAFARIVRYIVWIVGTIVGLNYLGFDLATFAIVGGAIGIGVGLGLQNLFSNVVSGIIILLEKTLKVGDFVDLQSGVVGTVTEIGVRYTRVTTNDEVDVLVPNSEFVNGRVTNWTYGGAYRRVGIPFGVAYGSDKKLVEEAALAAAAKVPGLLNDGEHKAHVFMRALGESSLDFELGVWVGPEVVKRPGRVRSMCLWALEDELTARGIEIPFPQRDVHMRSVASGSGASSLSRGNPTIS